MEPNHTRVCKNLGRWLDLPFVYVECGARGSGRPEVMKAFPKGEYVGVEPDAAEYSRLAARPKKRRRFFPVAAGANRGRDTLYLTRNPSCCSLLQPNRDVVDRYRECAAFFEVVGSTTVEIVPLDSYLPEQGFDRIDVLKLDVQGAEHDILAGARGFLDRTILAVHIEVEFLPMYVNQPLFGDIDAELRHAGFELFDLSRYRLCRDTWPAGLATRGQLLWGLAIYFKDYRRVADIHERIKLAALAWLSGFTDYALAVIDDVLQVTDVPLTSDDRHDLELARRELIDRLQDGRLVRGMLWLDRSMFGPAFRRAGRACRSLADAFESVARRRVSVWRD